MERSNGSAEKLLRDSRTLGSDMRELAGDVAEVGRELRERVDLSRHIQAHPFRSLLIAAGVGYVLGGGLFTRLTGQLLRVGGRAVLLPLMRNQLESMIAGAPERDVKS